MGRVGRNGKASFSMTGNSRVRRLALWMNGERVGNWYLSSAGDTLEYASGWVASRQGRPLSLSLPFSPGNRAYRGDVVRAYFENLLPDSQAIRDRLARRFQSRTTDAFDLLAQVGRDCVGALQILPDDADPGDVRTINAEPLDEAAVAQLIRASVDTTATGLSRDDDDFRISIAGAQEKTALLWHDGQWMRPHGATPTTHIFKLPMGLVGNMSLDLSTSVENEWLCAQILAAYGLPVANCIPLVFEDQKVLSVERFDRRMAPTGNWLLRLPQEDMCQATGIPPHLKYEADGGPGVERIMGLLDGSRHREQDRTDFFRSQLIFWMLCAPDGHAKNFSLALLAGGAYQLTPLYDVMSAYPLLGAGPGTLSPFKVKLAMAVRSKNAHWKMRDVLRRHWLEMGGRYGVVSPDGLDAEAIVDDLVARTPDVVNTVSKQLPADFPPALANSILTGLLAAASRLAA